MINDEGLIEFTARVMSILALLEKGACYEYSKTALRVISEAQDINTELTLRGIRIDKDYEKPKREASEGNDLLCAILEKLEEIRCQGVDVETAIEKLGENKND